MEEQLYVTGHWCESPPCRSGFQLFQGSLPARTPHKTAQPGLSPPQCCPGGCPSPSSAGSPPPHPYPPVTSMFLPMEQWTRVCPLPPPPIPHPVVHRPHGWAILNCRMWLLTSSSRTHNFRGHMSSCSKRVASQQLQ